MAYPVVSIRMPVALVGAPNGNLPVGMLEKVGCPGRPLAKLYPLAARAWRAFAAEIAARFGIDCTCTSTPDAYRSYDIQKATFLTRYTTTRLAGRPTKVWEGTTYWQKPGTAMAATPGTSNHGLGLAIDVAIWLADTGQVQPITARMDAFNWMLLNGFRYGFSWETQSEPWHIRYWAGDALPAAVLDYEQGPPPPDPPPTPTPTPPPSPTRTVLNITKTSLTPETREQVRGNQDVALLQVMALGLYQTSGNEDLNCGSIDKDYGPRTQKAAMVMQALNGVPVDGRVGPVSWGAFLNADGQ